MANTFKYDLELGEKYEQEFMQLMLNDDLTIVKMQGNFSEYDFELTDPETNEVITIELKSDRQAITTGNVALELHKVKNGVQCPAGLSASTANTFVFKLIGMPGFYAIPTKKIKDIIEHGQYYKTIYSGDNKASYTALFNKDYFLKQCKHII